jgi:ABC-type glycerol-3-phosphate transport system substrate-binding protein
MILPRPSSEWRGRIVLLLLLCTVFAFATLSSCGSATSQPAPIPIAPGATVTVPFALPTVTSLAGFFDDQTLALLDDQIAAFEAANPDVKVEIVAAPRDVDERREAFAALLGKGDTTRDIYLLNPTWLTQFSAHDWLAPMDRYAESAEIELDDFFASSIQANTVARKLMALPWTVDGGILYYRQDLLDKHAYAPPRTWADLQRLSLDIKTQEDLPFGYVWQAAPYESLTCTTLEFVRASGGAVLDDAGNVIFDSAETRRALQQMVELLASGASPSEVTTFREAATLNAFQSKDAAFMRNWSYTWDRVNDHDSAVAGEVGIAPLPTSCLGGSSLALSAYSQHPEQALRFMTFLVDYEQQAQVALHGVQPPALEKVYGDQNLLAAKPSLQALHAALSATRPRPQTARYAELSETIYTEVNRMLNGEQDIEATVTTIQHRLEILLGGP